ncbi:TonB-dependent receptor [Ginsengibacter hankyongi]|uniref:TonB-dependent receptor n=2 Tax=Ginsengibacter hankyongi TaxID=2607284 RepID=A0A5J5IC64_9BACT|nr:TonB-dependent receptor [Ginsengibacter hankyongi]
MKFSMLSTFLLSFVLCSYAKYATGQDLLLKKITLKIKSENIKSVLTEIEKNSELKFMYSPELINSSRKVSISAKNEEVSKILNRVLQPLGIRYEVVNSYIILIRNREGDSLYIPELNSLFNEKVLLKVITGSVLTEEGQPLQGVSVTAKGTQIGTSTDAKGNFSLNVDESATTLVFTYVGYISSEVSIVNRQTVSIVLHAETKGLNEVVVIGYGTQKKSNLTGSVSSISERDIKAVAITSPDQALEGKAPGVQVTQNSSAPGGGTTIRIRGGNSIQGGNEPLYVIDGVPVYNDNGNSGASLNGLSSISPGDIASIEILKDASATAIYGSRGANGVVLITTKRGKSGQANINFEVYHGIQNVRRKYPLLNGSEFAKLVNEANTNVGSNPVYTQQQIDSIGVGTDWQNQIFRTAPISNYYLSANGGDEKTQYAISGSYFKQEGIVLNSDFERSSFRLNLDRKLTSKLKVGNSLTFSHSMSNRSSTDGFLGSPGQVISNTLQISPTVPVYNSDGSYTLQNISGGQLTDNPVALAKDSKSLINVNRVLGNVYGEYDIIPGLRLKVLVGIDGVFQKGNNYLPKSVLSGFQQGGLASISNTQSISWLNENTLTYDKDFNEIHHLTFLAGYTQQANRTEYSYAASRNFINDNLGYNNLGAGSVALSPNSGVGTWGLTSYLGRINYGYKDKYLLTLTGRVDGSSRFGVNNRYGFFPSGAAAWRMNKEDFIKNLHIFSDLKLRVSYGLTGNQEGIGNYPSLALLSVQNYVLGNQISSGVGPSQIANPDLKWESTSQSDVGLDISFFNNRLSLTADAYIKHTKDLLLNITIPGTSGYSSALKNIGEVENKGVEFGINSENIAGAFKWTTDFNISFNKNTVLNIGNVSQIFAGQTANIAQNVSSGIIEVGKPLGSFYGYVTDGVFQASDKIASSAQPSAKPGDRRYKDLNGDNKINDNDRTILGQAQPKFLGGITNNFSFKGFELSVFLQGVYGNSILNANRFELEYLSGTTNQDRDMLNRWTPTNTNTDIPRASVNRPANVISNRQVEDGSYLRLKNIQLAYNLPENALKLAKIRSLKIYVSAQNYITWTRYSGYDPEVNRYGQDNVSQGFDYGSYPAAKTILFGLNLGL